MGKAQPSGPAGFDEILPAVDNARRHDDLNRRNRRAMLARAQAGRPAEFKTDEYGVTRMVKGKKLRLKTHAAQVAFARGVERHGV